MKTSIKDRIDILKAKYHMTNADLSKRIHVSEATLNNYMRNPDSMTYGTIKAMCATFHCPVEYLLDGRDTEAEKEVVMKYIRSALT